MVLLFSFFFFKSTPPTVIYTLSLHDALPIYSRDQRESHRRELRDIVCRRKRRVHSRVRVDPARRERLSSGARLREHLEDRKSTRLNSSHMSISYAVFCLKKKKNNK